MNAKQIGCRHTSRATFLFIALAVDLILPTAVLFVSTSNGVLLIPAGDYSVCLSMPSLKR